MNRITRGIAVAVAAMGLAGTLGVTGLATPASAAPQQVIINPNQPICGANVSLTGLGIDTRVEISRRGKTTSFAKVYANGSAFANCLSGAKLVMVFDGYKVATTKLNRLTGGNYHLEAEFRDLPSLKYYTLEVVLTDSKGLRITSSPEYNLLYDNGFR